MIYYLNLKIKLITCTQWRSLSIFHLLGSRCSNAIHIILKEPSCGKLIRQMHHSPQPPEWRWCRYHMQILPKQIACSFFLFYWTNSLTYTCIVELSLVMNLYIKCPAIQIIYGIQCRQYLFVHIWCMIKIYKFTPTFFSLEYKSQDKPNGR